MAESYFGQKRAEEDWFTFDYSSAHYGKIPLDVLISEKFDELSRRELDILIIGWRKNIYSFFEPGLFTNFPILPHLSAGCGPLGPNNGLEPSGPRLKSGRTYSSIWLPNPLSLWGRYFLAREIWRDKECKVLEHLATLQM